MTLEEKAAPKRSRNLAELANRTDYGLHKSQTSARSHKNIYDFTSFRIRKLISDSHDESQKMLLVALLKDFRAGNVAIGWDAGSPIWIKVTREKT